MIRKQILVVFGVSFLVLALPLLPSCSRGGGGHGITEPLRLVGIDFGENQDILSFSPTHPIVFTFNNPIYPTAVHPEGMKLVLLGAGVRHEGRVVVDGRSVIFHPSVMEGDENDFNPPNDPPVNPYGLEALARYKIEIVVGDETYSIRDKANQVLESIEADGPFKITTGAVLGTEDPTVPPNLCSIRDYYENHPEHDENIDLPASCGDPGIPYSAWKVLSPIFDPPADPAREENASQGTYWYFEPYVTPDLDGITFVFDEPMDRTKFIPGKNLTLINMDKNFPEGEIVPTRLTHSPDGREFTLHPLFPLGKGLEPSGEDPGGYLFKLVVGWTGSSAYPLTDLAGNELANPQVFYFHTYYDPGHEDVYSFTVEFDQGFLEDSNGFIIERDSYETDAQWPCQNFEFLEGAVAQQRTARIDPQDSGYNVPQPLTTIGSRIQHLYEADPSQLNRNVSDEAKGNEAIVGCSWGPRSNYVFKGIYQNMTMKMGIGDIPTTYSSGGLSYIYDENYNLGADPELLFEGNYVCPAAIGVEWFPWPTFVRGYEWDGENQVLFEINVPEPLTHEQGGIPTYQLFRNWSVANTPRLRVWGLADEDVAGYGERTIYHYKFYLIRNRSKGQCKWIDLEPGINPGSTVSPEFFAPLAVEDTARYGTEWILEFQGTTEDAAGGPDVTDVSDWTGDLESLSFSASGKPYEFLRFRFFLRANIRIFSLDDYLNLPPDTTEYPVPRIDSLSIAWTQN